MEKAARLRSHPIANCYVGAGRQNARARVDQMIGIVE
jgi:hypothetical protein